jgi:alpha-beta hydrolase superfamily lysophospholipase
MPFRVRSPLPFVAPFCRALAASALIAAALSVGGCFNPVSSKLYQPAPLAAAPLNWSGRAPIAVTARTVDGLALTGWFWAPEQPHDDVLLFLPGRAGNRDIAAKQAEAFAAGGRGVLVASYRGYGDNPGKPDESGLYRDGAAFADLARTLRPAGGCTCSATGSARPSRFTSPAEPT